MPFGAWKGCRKDAAWIAVLLAVGIAACAGGCGRKEGVSAKGPPPAGSLPTAGNAADPSGREGLSPPPAAGFSVFVVPLSPSRIAPPAVSVRTPIGKGAEVLGVRWLVNGSEAGEGQTLAPGAFRAGDRLRATVKLRAAGGEMSLETQEVLAVDALPAATDVRVEPAVPIPGGTVRAVVQSGDPDGHPLTHKFQWYVDDLPVVAGGDSFTLNGVKRGSWIHVKVTPNDGFSDGAWRESPRYQVVNAHPVVKSVLPKELSPGRRFVYRILAEDPDGDPLTYTLTKSPPGMVLNEGTLEWQVPGEYLGANVEAVVEITDGHGGRTVQNISMTIQKPKGTPDR